MSKLVRLNPPTAPMSKCLTQITRSHPTFHDVLLTESQASLRIADLTASESAGSRQQAAGSRQQAAGSRQQAAGSRQQADSGDRYQPHRCEHVLHRTLIAAMDYRKGKHLKTASEQRSYVRYLQLRGGGGGGGGVGEKVSIHETGVNFLLGSYRCLIAWRHQATDESMS